MNVRILIIDDDEAIRLSLALLLQAKGYEVFAAKDGAEGVAQFIEHKPQIVLTDMIMPRQQGIAAIEKIRQLDPDVGIIAMSGSIRGGSASSLERALAAGANASLEKPCEPAEVLEVIERVRKA